MDSVGEITRVASGVKTIRRRRLSAVLVRTVLMMRPLRVGDELVLDRGSEGEIGIEGDWPPSGRSAGEFKVAEQIHTVCFVQVDTVPTLKLKLLLANHCPVCMHAWSTVCSIAL